jgi:hypothetical protein
MLEYTKTILLKVSFDNMLFEKELRKGMNMLGSEEAQQLEQWCRERFSDRYLPLPGGVSPAVLCAVCEAATGMVQLPY